MTRTLVAEHDRVAACVSTYAPYAARIKTAADFISLTPTLARTVNRRFQALDPLWPAAVSDKPRVPWAESLRQRWFRSQLDRPLVEVDVSSSQTQVLAFLLGDTELEAIATGQSFKKYLSELAWDRSRTPGSGFRFREPLVESDRYRGPEDERLVALVKEAWMRRLYGSQPWQIVEDQRDHLDTLGQGWDRANLERFLGGVPGWKSVSTFLAACQKIGTLARVRYEGVTVRDPFDQIGVRWHPAAREEKALSTRGSKRGFTFYVDIPRYDLKDGEFRVDGRKMKDCIAPRWIHLLDAMLNGLVVEEFMALFKTFEDTFNPEPAERFTLVAVHDAWLVGASERVAEDLLAKLRAHLTTLESLEKTLHDSETQDPAKARELTGKLNEVTAQTRALTDELRPRSALIAELLPRASQKWFEALKPVYQDLLGYLRDTEFEQFARDIQAAWVRRRDACRVGRTPWPIFRLD